MMFRRAEITTATLTGIAVALGLTAVGASFVTGVTPCSLLSCDKPAATATTVAAKIECPESAKAETVAAKASDCTTSAKAVPVAAKSDCATTPAAVAVASKAGCADGARAQAIAAKADCSKSAEAVAVAAKSECATGAKAVALASKSECASSAKPVAASAECPFAASACTDGQGKSVRLMVFRGGFFPVAVPANFATATSPAAKGECSGEKAVTVANKADCDDKPDCCSTTCDEEKPAQNDAAPAGPIASKSSAN